MAPARRRSALVALVAILLHALTPLLASASPQVVPDHVELCTALGVVTVQVEPDRAPAGAPAAPEHCPVCAFQTVVAAAMPAVGTPLAASLDAVGAERPQSHGCYAPIGARPRAPPPLS
jgi:hypothetical protein